MNLEMSTVEYNDEGTDVVRRVNYEVNFDGNTWHEILENMLRQGLPAMGFFIDVERADKIVKFLKEEAREEFANVLDKLKTEELEDFEEEEVSYRIGECVKISGGIYLLSAMGTNKVAAVCISTGNRWKDAVEVPNCHYSLTEDDVDSIVGSKLWTLVENPNKEVF